MADKKWKYFDYEEFACKCCGATLISTELVDKLDEVREMLKRPMIIESGYRCAKHNTAVGGKRTSAHRKGWAVDIACKTPRERFQLVNALFIVGFKRIGIGHTFIHADVSPEHDPEVMWDYRD